MRPFRNQIIVGGAEHRAEAVRVGHPPFGAIALRAVLHRLRIAVDRAFEQAGVVDAFHAAERRARQVKCLGRFRAGDQRARERAVRTREDTQQRKGIIVAPGEQGSDGATRRLHITFQMSRAYSPIVRSDENHPILATLSTADRPHAAGSLQRASTMRWAAA